MNNEMNNKLTERYYILKGMFAELKEKMEEEKLDFMSLGLSHGVIHFDDFKFKIHSKELEEINVELRLEGKEVGYVNVEKDDLFQFDFEEVAVDFVALEEN
ncbi:hypothetical protein [Oceanirhabdus sp. W0125-5]|uniref:hypothetical protein n=1 Tax=Oceanirhabdus sp. W0125-5 TaxID=2999116 RepID=UPI0022F32C56|nr:hypothetical protein [Oceanirhabdus sp. W0125-5]WBW97587.1 hypothetical protein OW730_01925 [Oceanirhabdus sp. W0125-5]